MDYPSMQIGPQIAVLGSGACTREVTPLPHTWSGGMPVGGVRFASGTPSSSGRRWPTPVPSIASTSPWSRRRSRWLAR